MMDEKDFYRESRRLLIISEHIICDCRRQDYEGVNFGMQSLCSQLESWTQQVLEYGKIYQNQIYFPDMDSITVTISQLMKAQQAGDYILMADYLELSFNPMLLQVQQNLRDLYGDLGCRQLSEENCARNLLQDKKLARELRNVKVYPLEETNTGFATIALTDERGSYYLHSNVNPILEAEQLVSQYYDPQYEQYMVIGCGLGFHIKKLLEMGEYIIVNVYESDARMIKTMLSYWDWSDYFAQGRIHILYDVDNTVLARDLASQTQAKVMIHAPSLRNIRNTKTQEELRQYYIKESGFRKMKQLLESNFYQNHRNCRDNVDSLRECIEGKTVVIVAAGPSFSRNAEYLKDLPEGTVIIAVTTIYRKLLSIGIRPDYVIHSDPQSKTFCHLEGIEEKIPLLTLSTAFEGCARKYPGRSYIIYQKGYKLAEEYAERHAYRTYETGGSVAMVALDIAVQNSASKVILVGLDLAFTDGLAHAKGVSIQQTGDLSQAVQVPGYNGGLVATSLIFSDFIKWFSNYAGNHANEKCKIINATEGGAAIPGIMQMPLREALSYIE